MSELCKTIRCYETQEFTPETKKIFNLKKFFLRKLAFVTKTQKTHKLNCVDLRIKQNDRIGIIGESGCGKSTLLNLLTGASTPTSGKILMNGQELASGKRDWNNLAYLPQKPFTADGTIIENVTLELGENSQNRSKVKKYLRQAKLEAFASEGERGLEFNIGENGQKLSGGERQRLAIARAALTFGERRNYFRRSNQCLRYPNRT